MAYWAATMQDDVFIIAGGGWLAARDLREARKETSDDGKVKWLEEGDLTVNKVRLVADVIPPAVSLAPSAISSSNSPPSAPCSSASSSISRPSSSVRAVA